MDLDNQTPTTANDKTDSATPDFGGPIDANKLDDKPSFDMDAVNQAVMATDAKDPNLQNTFDVNEISLDDVPTSQEELDNRLQSDPNMSLAGNTKAQVDLSGMVTEGQSGAVEMGAAMDMSATPAVEEKKEPAASFVDGDIIDEPAKTEEASSTESTTAESFGNINVDPLGGTDTGMPAQSAPPATDTPAAESTDAKADAAATDGKDKPAGAESVGNTITVPKPKSNKMLFVGIGVVAVVSVVAFIVLVVFKS